MSKNESNAARYKILVVDDNIDQLTSVSDALEEYGFNVERHINANTTLAWAKEHAFAVVLSDYMMPQVDGVKLLKSLRQLNPRAACFLMTGVDAEALPEQAKEIAEEIFYKPFNTEMLVARLRQRLAQYHNELNNSQEN